MPNREQEARELARRHYAVEEGLTDVFILRETVNVAVERSKDAATDQGGTIKLLEVNENTIPTGIDPIQFGPAPAAGIHFSSVIVEVTPDEFEKIRKQELPLPNGWGIGERIPKHEPAPLS